MTNTHPEAKAGLGLFSKRLVSLTHPEPDPSTVALISAKSFYLKDFTNQKILKFTFTMVLMSQFDEYINNTNKTGEGGYLTNLNKLLLSS